MARLFSFLSFFMIYSKYETVTGFLHVSVPAVKGGNASLNCIFPIEVVHDVKWFHLDNLEGICKNTGSCSNKTNERYKLEMQFGRSILLINKAMYEFDEGKWRCQINDKLEASADLFVYSLPSEFDFENPLPSGSTIPQDGQMFEARAVCVYPKTPPIKLQYKIQGDSVYNDFVKEDRHVEIFFSDDPRYFCLPHEHTVIAKIKVEKGDFLNIDAKFRFLLEYKEVGIPIPTKSTINLRFADRPCDSSPCQNNGTCVNKSNREYFCNCPIRFNGVSCENKVDPCTFELCKNGGTCRSNIEMFIWQCSCPKEFTGETCSSAVTVDGSSSSSSVKSTPSVFLQVFNILLAYVFLYHLKDGFTYRVMVVVAISIAFANNISCFAIGNKSLNVKQYPKNGEEGVLECKIYAMAKNITLNWMCDGRKIISCSLPPSSCERNVQYYADISKSSSRLIIHRADYERDDGNWSCVTNGVSFTTHLFVISPLKHFLLHKANGKRVNREGMELSASLQCVYPTHFERLVLQYKIQGAQQFHNFTKGKVQHVFERKTDDFCREYEFRLSVQITLNCTDFDDLNVAFKFVYFTLAGESVSTNETDFLNFPGISNCREDADKSYHIGTPHSYKTTKTTTASNDVDSASTKGPVDSDGRCQEYPVYLPLFIISLILIFVMAIIIASLCKKTYCQNSLSNPNSLIMNEIK